ncbi:MAG TPA: hypothetical protein VIJ76_02400 [Galbitalea sp.]
MVEAVPLNVLRFVELSVERKSAWGPGRYDSRQIEVDGELLDSYLTSRAGRAVQQSTPLVDGHAGAVTAGAYLRALLGGPKDDPLREGRIAIGYCDGCLDASCGVLLGASLAIDGATVVWSGIGFEQLDEGPAPKLTPFWKKAAEPPPAIDATWEPQPFEPEITLRFDKSQYLEAIQAERRRLAAAGAQ